MCSFLHANELTQGFSKGNQRQNLVQVIRSLSDRRPEKDAAEAAAEKL